MNWSWNVTIQIRAFRISVDTAAWLGISAHYIRDRIQIVCSPDVETRTNVLEHSCCKVWYTRGISSVQQQVTSGWRMQRLGEKSVAGGCASKTRHGARRISGLPGRARTAEPQCCIARVVRNTCGCSRDSPRVVSEWVSVNDHHCSSAGESPLFLSPSCSIGR